MIPHGLDPPKVLLTGSHRMLFLCDGDFLILRHSPKNPLDLTLQKTHDLFKQTRSVQFLAKPSFWRRRTLDFLVVVCPKSDVFAGGSHLFLWKGYLVKKVIVLSIIALMGTTLSYADPIDPFNPAFTQLGDLTTTGTNTVYTINTSGTPTLSLPNGTTISGEIYADTPGHDLAVFDFASIYVGATTTISATGDLPLVLLSRSNVEIDGVINVSGGSSGNGSDNPGPSGPGGDNFLGVGSSFLLSSGGSGFGGAGGASGIGVYRIDPFTGQPITVPPLPGGPTYGNLQVSLQGGSTTFTPGFSSGGGGGGAIEIGAVGSFDLGPPNSLGHGEVLANGGSGVFGVGGAGGSGGGIFIHASTVNGHGAGLLSAVGGSGAIRNRTGSRRV